MENEYHVFKSNPDDIGNKWWYEATVKSITGFIDWLPGLDNFNIPPIPVPSDDNDHRLVIKYDHGKFEYYIDNVLITPQKEQTPQ